MTLPPAKKNSMRFQTADSDIESLQQRLLKSLNTAFDPTAATKSDDFFLAQDYSIANTATTADTNPFRTAQNPYKTLTDKARSYVEKAKTDKPRSQTAAYGTKKSDTFLTYVEMEGNLRKERVDTPPIDEEPENDPLPLTYDHILGDVTSTGKGDDLEELRKMIRKTKQEMSDYGKELMSLKNDILGVNSYAAKELGYGANNDLLYNMESSINSLGTHNEFKFMKRGDSMNSNSKGLKSTTTTSQNENSKNRRNTYSNPSATGPASFIVSKRSLGTGLRSTTYKGGFKK